MTNRRIAISSAQAQSLILGAGNGAPRRRQRPRQRNGRQGGRRARADIVLAQGVGKTVTRAFGGKGHKLGNGRMSAGLAGWDAFHPYHLPLPRAVAPYTIVRTTALISSPAKVNIIGSYGFNDLFGLAKWSTVGMVSSINQANQIRDTGPSNAFIHNLPFPGANSSDGTSFTAVPAAVSVQVMNPNPLVSSAGIIAGAVSGTQLDLRDRSQTWNNFAKEYVSFMRPRLMSAGKLSLRGVQADSFPMNMSALSDFRPVEASEDDAVSWDASADFQCQGFSPIVIVNYGADLAEPLVLNYLITVEWRVRFDISNPAVASHSNHGITSDAHWSSLIQAAAQKGSGMMDIAEKVANYGSAAVSAYKTISPIVQGTVLPLMA